MIEVRNPLWYFCTTMPVRRPRTLLLLLLICIVPGLAPAQLAPEAARFLDHLSQETSAELSRDGMVRRDFDNHRDLRYLPDHPLARRIEQSVQGTRPNIITEAIMYLDNGVTDEEFLGLYNAFRRVSELSYLMYFNPEKGKPNELFYESYRVPDPETNRPLPDPVASEIPESDSFYVGQEIPPFGYIVSEYAFLAQDNAFLFSGRNLDRFYYRDVPVLGPENMFTHVLVVRWDESVVAYGVGGARVFTLFGILSGRIETPFSARTTAMFDWFNENYLKPLRR